MRDILKVTSTSLLISQTIGSIEALIITISFYFLFD